ncbi:MAG: DUF2845 domain-containing protein [Proteobacteria bacterium]|nr:DUF2845 domain-containing protein [Pseudomonadota bacterium]MBU1708896.1 DUF2845 domain-containing protein [Pseudomonadota bacterium]
MDVAKIILLSAVVFLLNAFPANAAALKVLKCKGEKISAGDSSYFVLKNCGEPAYKETLSNEGCVKIEQWYYDCMDRGFIDILKFEGGKLLDRYRGEDSEGMQVCE